MEQKKKPHFFFFLFISSPTLQFIFIWLSAHYNRCITCTHCWMPTARGHWPLFFWPCLFVTDLLVFTLSAASNCVFNSLFSMYTNTDYSKSLASLSRDQSSLYVFIFIKYYLLYCIVLFLIMVYVSCVLIDGCPKHQNDV